VPGGSGSGSHALDQVRRFLLALSDRDAISASGELSTDATYHVPGNSPVAGTVIGRHQILMYFERVFGFASGSEALKWIDWMVGTDLVSVLVEAHLQSGLSEFEGHFLFVFSSNPLGGISEIWLFLDDQARFDRFFTRAEAGTS
jgi:hypothetical protein